MSIASRIDGVRVPNVPGGWEFTPEVAAGFDDHVAASVPFYDSIQALVAEVADWLAPKGSVVVDLGCATGTTAEMIRARHPGRDHQIHLYDESAAMLAAAHLRVPGAVLHEDRLESGSADHPPASLTLCLFTLQFLDPAARIAVLGKAHAASRNDGAIILAEKLRLTDPRWTDVGISVSHDYKERQGIGADAIRAKERSLRGVLIPWSDSQNQHALRAAGWQRVETLFRWHQWAVYGAFASAGG